MLNPIRRIPKELLFGRPSPPIVRAVRAESLTYLEEAALNDLFESVRALEQNGTGGILIEAGCAWGGSAIVIAAAKSEKRLFYVFDVFGMIPPPSEQDGIDVRRRYREIKNGKSAGIGGGKYYGYEENLFDKVTENFRRHGVPVGTKNIHLVRGLFQDTLHIDEPVALAHIDGDWYESVRTCLERIEPHLVPGGALVVDDYDAWSGCRKAVDEYFAGKKDRYEFVRKSRLHVRRKRDSTRRINSEP
ncbi:MAG: TylF/MycF/NovP-related O-methyltransferase [Candidatus Binatia bacterium]